MQKNKQRPKYSIIVPFYNEEENIEGLYAALCSVMEKIGEPYEFIFVNDGSTDNTYKILSKIYENDPHVTLVALGRNFGQTAALMAGFDYSKGDILIPMDGDLQHSPSDIPKLIKKLEEGYDVVSGWRKKRVDSLFVRRIPSAVANFLIRKLSGVPIHDFGTTFKAYKRNVLEDLRLYGELHRFIPALLSWKGVKIAEIPITNIVRKKGKSKYGISRTFRVLFDLLTIKFLLNFLTAPLHFFGTIGLACLFPGIAISFFLVIRKLAFSVDIFTTHGPLLLLAILLIIVSIQFMCVGLIGEMLTRIYFETGNRKIYSVSEVKQH